ncbi:glutathione S-transferase family protein [Kiloniella laminariae]|uniref:Glutathione S-transferase family protein n=1 Tax=Kiloniella laminariae TaxID=454162 RepID=A0ABT4LIB4_9PROT|nr:glutathione S-transferase family protein [Kiloniella laminariae]MCZ4280848.1 glutathione S-transferase family protein [Kiloniella laminariae]
MYKLYWDRGGANMAIHALLEELECTYSLIEIDLSQGMQHQPDYLAINPNGRVPTLLDGQTVIYESAAILLYLADKHPQTALAPSHHSHERAVYCQWLVWMTNTLQETANAWAHPEIWAETPAAQQDVKNTAARRMGKQWDLLEAQLARTSWLAGDRITAADLHLFMISYWSRRYPERAEDRPRLKQHATRVLQRPAVQRMMEQEGLSWTL